MSPALSSLCSRIAPSATLRLNALVTEKRKQGYDIISLAAGEPDFETPPHIKQAGKQAIDSGKSRYTATAGMPELRAALADFLKREKGLPYTAKQLIVGTGAKQVIMGALLATLEPGDQVLIPAPCWLSYPEMVRMAGGEPVMVHASCEQGFVPSAAQLHAAVTPRTKAIIINSPNNPTGVVWPREALLAVAELAREHDLFILSDEIYESHIYNGSVHYPMASLSEDAFSRTITISGFSKAYAMTGWRLGYAAGPADVIAAMDAYQGHATGNPCSISQYAGLAAITGDQGCVREMKLAFEKRCGLILHRLAEIPGLSFVKPQGAFYVLVDISGLLGYSFEGRVIRSDNDFAEMLLAHGLVSVVPGSPFFAPNCVRLSYAINEEKLNEAADRIAGFVAALSPAEMLKPAAS